MMKNSHLGRRRWSPRSLSLIGVGILLALLIVFPSVFKPVSTVAHWVGAPFFGVTGFVGDALGDKLTLLHSKRQLIEENNELRHTVRRLEGEKAQLELERDTLAIVAERFGATPEGEDILVARVTAGPLGYPFGTLTIDRGKEHGITTGELVLSENGIIIGAVLNVYGDTSTVRLFTAAGVSTEVTLGVEGPPGVAEGRGAGTFRIRLPRGIAVATGTPLVLPSIPTHILGVIEESVVHPADSFQLLYATPPVNTLETKIVGVLRGSAPMAPAFEETLEP